MRQPPLRLVRVLLALYPRAFRRAYAADMTRLFAERHAEAVRDGRPWRFTLRALANLAATGIAERWQGGRPTMTGFARDIRYALRLLRRQPSFALFVILTLGVGIGASTAIFSVVNTVLLRPLPYDDADRLVRVWGRFDPESGFDFPQFPLSNPEFLEYQAHTRALEAIGAFANSAVTVGGDAASDPERVRAAAFTAAMFDALHVAPAPGRPFSAEEMQPGGPDVAVLSHGYWQTRFGGDASVLGRKVSINGRPTEVVGVMPEGFGYPSLETRLWTPLRIDPADPGGRSSHGVHAIARLADGASFESARAELAVLMEDWKVRFPDVHTGHYLFLQPLLEDVAGTVRPTLLTLLGATGLVLLIVCANVASLVLARGEGRTREIAIRGALGSDRWRLVRLSLAESVVLAAAGGTLGLALAYGGIRALVAIDPASIPRSVEIGIDPAMTIFAAGAAALAAALFGLAPALRGARADLHQRNPGAQVLRRRGAGGATHPHQRKRRFRSLDDDCRHRRGRAHGRTRRDRAGVVLLSAVAASAYPRQHRAEPGGVRARGR